ncbi:predicted protein [Plenodomus lingam JN3]|uniref:Predicted protein n=1 Tax=Leptosphaeria maculans (strain JN3 / isolate v23.1.3 / race Av1-4-5-6-7-8) TaxID=985895 RepID=E5A1J9_LEPMJ|nr:predicted protein [Plenodomus lingam JN3]CBX97463.1 predicted protein [Plenodomus lingam JN3]
MMSNPRALGGPSATVGDRDGEIIHGFELEPRTRQ